MPRLAQGTREVEAHLVWYPQVYGQECSAGSAEHDVRRSLGSVQARRRHLPASQHLWSAPAPISVVRTPQNRGAMRLVKARFEGIPVRLEWCEDRAFSLWGGFAICQRKRPIADCKSAPHLIFAPFQRAGVLGGQLEALGARIQAPAQPDGDAVVTRNPPPVIHQKSQSLPSGSSQEHGSEARRGPSPSGSMTNSRSLHVVPSSPLVAAMT